MRDAALDIDWATLGLVFGMMVLSQALAEAGAVGWLVLRAAGLSRGRPAALALLVGVMSFLLRMFLPSSSIGVVSGPVSRVLFPATELLAQCACLSICWGIIRHDQCTSLCPAQAMAPTLCAVAQRHGIEPQPLLVAASVLGDVGGAASMLGAIPNMVIANSIPSVTFLGFLQFVLPGKIPSDTGFGYLFRSLRRRPRPDMWGRGHEQGQSRFPQGSCWGCR